MPKYLISGSYVGEGINGLLLRPRMSDPEIPQ